jgi:beta-alanine--pyruvate transaminase
LTPIEGAPTKRAFGVFLDCWQQGLMLRSTGDILALSPPLIVQRSHIDQMVETLRGAIRRAA